MRNCFEIGAKKDLVMEITRQKNRQVSEKLMVSKN